MGYSRLMAGQLGGTERFIIFVAVCVQERFLRSVRLGLIEAP